MKNQLLKTKTELKELAQNLKNLKTEFKLKQRNFSLLNTKNLNYGEVWRARNINPELFEAYSSKSSTNSQLYSAKHTFRHKHIAYCLLRGRSIEQIETRKKNLVCSNPGAKKCYCCNKPDMDLVNKFMKEIQDELAKA